MSNMYMISPEVDFRIARYACVLLLAVAAITGSFWAFSLLPKESVIQTTYGSDGSVTIDSEVHHPRTGLVEKCSARFNAVAVSADRIRLVAVSKNCEFGNSSEMLNSTIEKYAEYTNAAKAYVNAQDF